MSEEKKERLILKFILTILGDKGNQNRYSDSLYGAIQDSDKEKVTLFDCMQYIAARLGGMGECKENERSR